MGTIKISVYLNMCVCGAHGRIISLKGYVSREFYSFGEAQDVLVELLQKKSVTEEEFFFLGEEINSSCLPEKAGRVNTTVCDVINLVKNIHSEKNDIPTDYVM
jgi:hypothetical protein